MSDSFTPPDPPGRAAGHIQRTHREVSALNAFSTDDLDPAVLPAKQAAPAEDNFMGKLGAELFFAICAADVEASPALSHRALSPALSHRALGASPALSHRGLGGASPALSHRPLGGSPRAAGPHRTLGRAESGTWV